MSGIARIDKGELHAETLEHLHHQSMCPAVHVFARHDVVAGGKELENRLGGGHPRREREPVGCAFEHGDIAFQGIARGISRAGIFEARVLSKPRLHVSRCLEDWRHDCASDGLGFLAGVYHPGGKVVLLIVVGDACHSAGRGYVGVAGAKTGS